MLAFLGLINAADFVNDEAYFRSEFAKFQSKFGKLYASPLDRESRFMNFRANLIRANQLNEEAGSIAFGVTKFSDLSSDEMKNFNGFVRSKRDVRLPVAAPVNVKDVTPVDWCAKGKCPRVKDQGRCGSCWAFSTTFAVETANAMKTGKVTELAPQQLVDCDKEDGGCDGGDLPSAFEYLEAFGGQIAESDYAYKARDGSCRANKTDIAVPVKGFEWVVEPCEYTDCSKQDEEAFAKQIIAKGPAAICVEATDDWFSYTGPGMFTGKCGNAYNVLNHCVGISGIGKDAASGDLYYIVRNSWGASWGQNGDIRIPYNAKNKCGVADEAAFAVV